MAKEGGSLTPSFLRSKEGGTYEAHRVVERGDHNDGDAGDEYRASVRCPDKSDPPSFSCGLNDPNSYKDGGEFDEGEPGAGELGQTEGNKPLEFGCAPGKEENLRPQ